MALTSNVLIDSFTWCLRVLPEQNMFEDNVVNRRTVLLELAYNDVKLLSQFGFNVGKRLENFDRIVTDRRQEHCQPGGIRFLVSADREQKPTKFLFE